MTTPNDDLLLKSLGVSYFGLPMFDALDLQVEFEAKWRGATRSLQQLRCRNRLSIHEMINEAAIAGEIAPLELETLKPIHITRPGEVQGTTVRRAFYTCCIPFTGDDILWRLNPGIVEDFPDGEIFRGNLILTSLEKTDEEARDHFAEQLSRIREITTLQTNKIELFQAELPARLFDWFRAWSGGVRLSAVASRQSSWPPAPEVRSPPLLAN